MAGVSSKTIEQIDYIIVVEGILDYIVVIDLDKLISNMIKYDFKKYLGE